MAPFTMQLGSEAWVSPAKIKEEKEITELHYTSLLSAVSDFLSYFSKMSREKLVEFPAFFQGDSVISGDNRQIGCYPGSLE